MRFRVLFWRSCRLRCPRCGVGKLYRGWLAMYESCEHCEYRYARDPGYFLGAIYFNYGLTALLVTVSYVTLLLTSGYDASVLLWPHMAFCLLFPAWFFRYARSLWVGFDQFFDPVGIEKEEGTGAEEESEQSSS